MCTEKDTLYVWHVNYARLELENISRWGSNPNSTLLPTTYTTAAGLVSISITSSLHLLYPTYDLHILPSECFFYFILFFLLISLLSTHVNVLCLSLHIRHISEDLLDKLCLLVQVSYLIIG